MSWVYALTPGESRHWEDEQQRAEPQHCHQGQAEARQRRAHVSGRRGTRTVHLVDAKKVDTLKMVENGQWWQMSQRIQVRKDYKMASGFGSESCYSNFTWGTRKEAWLRGAENGLYWKMSNSAKQVKTVPFTSLALKTGRKIGWYLNLSFCGK